MEDGGKHDYDILQNLSIPFSISPEYQRVIDAGTNMVRELTGRPDLTTEQYLTFLFVNAYYYVRAKQLRAKEVIEKPSGILQIVPDNEPVLAEPPNPRIAVQPLPEVWVNMPAYVHKTLTDKKPFGSLKMALETMDVCLAAYVQEKKAQLVFPGRHVVKFPFVRSLQYTEPNLPMINSRSI
jgi:hypothetical protein